MVSGRCCVHTWELLLQLDGDLAHRHSEIRAERDVVEHRGVVNLITSGVARFSVGVEDRMSQNSSPAYDSSLEEIWLALAAGATLVVMDDATVRSGPDLVAWLRRERGS